MMANIEEQQMLDEYSIKYEETIMEISRICLLITQKQQSIIKEEKFKTLCESIEFLGKNHNEQPPQV